MCLVRTPFEGLPGCGGVGSPSGGGLERELCRGGRTFAGFESPAYRSSARSASDPYPLCFGIGLELGILVKRPTASRQLVTIAYTLPGRGKERRLATAAYP